MAKHQHVKTRESHYSTRQRQLREPTRWRRDVYDLPPVEEAYEQTVFDRQIDLVGEPTSENELGLMPTEEPSKNIVHTEPEQMEPLEPRGSNPER